MIRTLVCLGFLLFPASSVFAQKPSPEELRQLQQQIPKMQQKLERLSQEWGESDRLHGVHYQVNGETIPSDLADLAVHVKALEWIVRHNEFSKKASYQQTVEVTQQADAMLREIQDKGTRQYHSGSQICGYVSKVDQSVQPYALTLPENFEKSRQRTERLPLYVVLHGRGGRNEVAFITRHAGKKVDEDQKYIQIDVFGRTDNAFRWAGETDVFEAIDDVMRRFAIDESRMTLWGFSMGGAGAWHLGLHHPGQWVSAGAGAGFVDFYKYQNRSEQLPPYQHKTLRIYDALDYALNLANVPFVGYGGDMDKQLEAGQLMKEKSEELDVPMKLIIGKNIGHKFTPEAEAEFQEFLARHNKKGQPTGPGPREIRFITYTPKYNKCHWLEITELEQIYEPSLFESTYDKDKDLLNVKTENLRLVEIDRTVAEEISFNGQDPLPLRDAADALLPAVYYVNSPKGWQPWSYEESRIYQEAGSGRKHRDLQGPIDDAFMSSFVCVRGTGTAWSQAHQDWTDWTLDRFDREFDKWMRGKIRVVNDTEVTEELMQQSHLILFGDPGSNKLIARVLEDLPVQWNRETIEINGQIFPVETHGLAMIYPNPLNPRKYVVINSGMTTHEKDFKASNSWLFPKLGDVAVLRYRKTDEGYEETTEWADLFNSDWKLEE